MPRASLGRKWLKLSVFSIGREIGAARRAGRFAQRAGLLRIRGKFARTTYLTVSHFYLRQFDNTHVRALRTKDGIPTGVAP